MQLTKFPVVLVLLTASACGANIILRTSRPNEYITNLVEDVVNIVTSCYGHRIDGISVAGNLPDTLRKTLSERHLIPVALIGNIYKMDDQREKVPVQYRHKLHVFIVEASSFHQFDRLVQMNIEYSMWWNHMASFFILDMSPDCKIGIDYLFIAWQRNIINAKVICNRLKLGTTVLNYNPFTGQAPVSWQQFKVFPGINKHPFTVFSQNYRGNKTCDLDFEKTKNLGGYIIRAEGLGYRAKRDKLYPASYRHLRRNENFYDNFHDLLNATIRYSGKYQCPISQGQEILQFAKWINHAWSMGGNSFSTYPHGDVEIVIVSHFKGYKSQFKKIISVTNGDSQLGMGVVCLITLVFFKFFVRQALGPAFLNVIRITSNVRFTNLPSNNASRIYLACLLLFATTMQGIYWSKWTSLLTINIAIPNVNTLQECMDIGYKTIYVSENMNDLIENPVVKEHVVMINNVEKCLTAVSHDPSSVYFGIANGERIDEAHKLNLHIGKPIHSMYIGFPIKWDWYLEERINTIIQKIVEADIIEPWDTKCDPTKLTDYQNKEAVKNTQDFKKIDLYELSFAFGILGIGLACATITFIIEFSMPYTFLCSSTVFMKKR